MKSLFVCTSKGFVTKFFQIFIVGEVKNFAANNIVQIAGVSHVLRSVQRVSHRLEICASRERRLLQGQVQLGVRVKVQLLVRFLILVTTWLLISGFLGVVTLITRWGFCLARGFPHLSTNHRVNLIYATFSLIGDFLVPSQFACNWT